MAATQMQKQPVTAGRPVRKQQDLSLLIVFLLCLLPVGAAAQSFYGTVVGLVTDKTGATVPNSSVTLTNTDTLVSRKTATGADGQYRFVNIVPGNYRVDVQSKGFKHFTRTSINVQVDTTVRIDASLPVGEASETVEVTAESPLVDTQSATEGQVIEGRTVEDTPLNGRNVMNLLSITPGVIAQGSTAGSAQNNQNGGGHTNDAGWGNYQIAGGSAGQSAEFFDGVPLNILGSNTVALIPTQDAVQEFRVESNGVSPQFGRFAGGVVTMTSKTGSNKFHGSAYEYLRNTIFDANNYFSKQDGQPRPELHQNQYGFSLGGPIKKDKLFFSGSLERYKFSQGYFFQTNVPTLAERGGDFSALLGPPTGIINPCTGTPVQVNQIFDPTTTRTINGQVCRTPFTGNKILSTRFDPTANYILNTAQYFPAPNSTSPLGNYDSTTPIGGTAIQYNLRGDYTVSQKQQVFARYTYWGLSDLSQNVFANLTGNPPSDNRTQQAVVGDTYSINPKTILDLRLSYMRNYYDNAPPSKGTNLSAFGPAYGNLQSQVSFSELPTILIGPSIVPPEDDDYLMNFEDITSYQWTNSYVISANATKLLGRHTLNFGMDIRRLENNTTGQEDSPSGSFNFIGTFTSYSNSEPAAGAPGSNSLPPTGNAVADLLLGTPESGLIGTVRSVAQYEYYQGYYINDNWQATRKLSANVGIRWEIPGAYHARHDLGTVLLPNAADPLNVSGYTLKGQLALFDSSSYGGSTSLNEHFDLFAPRVGLAYQIDQRTIVRGAYGITYPPSDLFIGSAPTSSPINSAMTAMVTSVNGGLTPNNTLSSPFPANGVVGSTAQTINEPAGRSQAYLTSLEGQSISGPVPGQRYSYVQQYNFNIERQIGTKASAEVAYLGSKGTHLPLSTSLASGGLGLDQLPDQYDSMGSALLNEVTNPFAGKVSNLGALDGPTVPAGQLLRPYPQFSNVANSTPFYGASSYNSLQVKGQVRLGTGGTVITSYSWSKLLTNTDTLNGFLEAGSVGSTQDFTNLKADKSLSSFNVAQRFILSYIADIPVGKGKRFLATVNPLVDRFIGGWGLNGITTLQSGFPLVITAQPNSLSTYFGAGTIRPNVVPGCKKTESGSSQQRAANGWFNTACFVQGPDFTFGDESRVDPTLTSAGIANWDAALSKRTPIHEGVSLELRLEAFNVFNRVQFGVPGTSIGVPGVGTVTSTANNPRVLQLGAKIAF